MLARKILYLGPRDTLAQVRTGLDPYMVLYGQSQSDIEAAIKECDVILDASMAVHFSRKLLDQASRLRLFVAASTGSDHVDHLELERRGIPLFSLKEQTELLRDLTAAAEHSWLLLMACARVLRSAVDDVLSARWDRNGHPGIMLRGKKLGIVGCGRIGQLMGGYGEAFGLSAFGYDPLLTEWPTNIESVSLEKLMGLSDFITVHVPLEEGTRQLVGWKEFSQMRRGVVFVNTSRGEVVDEGALLQALHTGVVGAAGLDVLCGEPNVERHPLIAYSRKHLNLIITPHIGGYSPEALQRVLSDCCNRIKANLDDGSASAALGTPPERDSDQVE